MTDPFLLEELFPEGGADPSSTTPLVSAAPFPAPIATIDASFCPDSGVPPPATVGVPRSELESFSAFVGKHFINLLPHQVAEKAMAVLSEHEIYSIADLALLHTADPNSDYGKVSSSFLSGFFKISV